MKLPSREYLRTHPKTTLGLLLIISSNLGWILPLGIIPFLPIHNEPKVALGVGFFIYGQVSYNLGLLLVGSELITKLKELKIFFGFGSIAVQWWLLRKAIQHRLHDLSHHSKH